MSMMSRRAVRAALSVAVMGVAKAVRIAAARVIKGCLDMVALMLCNVDESEDDEGLRPEVLENDRYIDRKSIYWRLIVCRMTRYKRVKSESRGESVQSKGLYSYYLSAVLIIPSPLSLIYYNILSNS